MNTKSIALAIATLAFAGATLAQEAEPPVAVKTDGLPIHVAAKVQQKAQEGVTALRRYITNTRMVNELYIYSLVKKG